MKKLTFLLLILMELAYCSGSIASLLALEIRAYDGNLILELFIAAVLLVICALTVRTVCRRKNVEAVETADHIRTGIALTFGSVSALIAIVYIALEPWGGYFL